MGKQKYIDMGGDDTPTLIGQSAFLRGTDAGVCSVCHQQSATLVNGKCPKHAGVQPTEGDTKQPDLLGTAGRGNNDKGRGCWQKGGQGK